MIKNFKEVISQIKTQAPIQELISEYVTIKKSGRGFVSLCPFHEDKNPSMHIHPQKGIFKCFSCGTGGDVITFYSLINKKKWAEAIPDLALKYGIKVEYGEENKAETQVKNKLFEINNFAMEFFIKNLFSSEGKEALSYVKEARGLTDKTIEDFKIGFALNSWDSLYNYLSREKECPMELLVSSGLFIQKEHNKGSYDRYRNRIIFPIFNETNNVIGFGGRVLPGSEDKAKYINSPETLIFNKSYSLYGFNFAKEEIRSKDYSILSEGYLDVISAHQHGLKNTVASLGTALSSSQVRLLTKYTDSHKICLCLDSDAAGQKAVESIFSVIQGLGDYLNVDARVTTNLPAKDLDESLVKDGPEKVRELIENGKKIIYFILERITTKYKEAANNDDDFAKKETINELTEILISIKDPVEQREYTKFISHKLNIDEDALTLKLKEKHRAQKRKERNSYNRENNFKPPSDEPFKMYSEERFKHAEVALLVLYISSFPLYKEIKSELSSFKFIDEKHQYIKDLLDNIEEENLSPKDVLDKLVIECNEFKHIMSVVSDLSIKIDDDSLMEDNHLKNKDLILKEAKEWISWWVTNKKDMKGLAEELKDCNNNKEAETAILSKMMEVIKKKKEEKGE